VPTPSTSVLRRVLNGTTLLVLGRIWGSACTFLTLWLLADHLAGADFGRYTFYLAVFMLLDSFVDLGTGSIAVQRTADDPGEIAGTLAAARRIRAVSGTVGVVLVGGAAIVGQEPGALWIALATLYPVTHVLELSATVFRNRIAWGVPVAIRALASALSLTFVLFLLYGSGTTQPGPYLCAVALGSATANFALHFASRKHLPRERPPEIPWRAVLGAALPLGIAGLCQQTYFYVDNLFVRAFEGKVALGHYNVGIRLMSLCIMVGVYAALVALPWFKREHAAGRLGAAVARLAQPLFAIACFVTGALSPWSAALLRIFGEEFDDASQSLRWLLGASALVYIGAILMSALAATGHTKSVLVIAVAGLATNLVGNALLVPILGIDGAAIATFATEGLVVIGGFIALRRAGILDLGGARAWRWALGPLAFAVGNGTSFAIAMAPINLF